jgi:hypothetical protein
MKDIGFIPNGMAWNGGSRVLARLELLEMKEIGFSPTGMVWNGGIWFWPDCNGLEWRKMV